MNLLKIKKTMTDGTVCEVKESGSISIQEFCVELDGVRVATFKLENYKGGLRCVPTIKKQVVLPKIPNDVAGKTQEPIVIKGDLKNGMEVKVTETGGFTHNELVIEVNGIPVAGSVIKDLKDKRLHVATIKKGITIANPDAEEQEK